MSKASCAVYACDHGPLLDTDGWKKFKTLARREKKMLRMVNQEKLRSYCIVTLKFMYGYEVPCNRKYAVELNVHNGNIKWQDTTALEMAQLDECATLESVYSGVVSLRELQLVLFLTELALVMHISNLKWPNPYMSLLVQQSLVNAKGTS